MARRRSYTVMLVPDRDSTIRRFRVSSRIVWGFASLGAVGLLALTIWISHYMILVDRGEENKLLREENSQLRAQLLLVEEKIQHIDETLDRVERFDQKLRALTSLSDADRNLAIGPLDDSSDGSRGFEGRRGGSIGESLDARLDNLVEEAERNERSLVELSRYFEDRKSLLASTPSLWPARGWVTSDFGLRLDPYTAKRVMHNGMDIANRHGTPVIAPADGVVIFAGMEGGYGKVLVLDHGYGIKTRYAHLSEINVSLGERVRRAQRIAAIGNTGRSTGPHLHYEVRVNGISENPRKFILE